MEHVLCGLQLARKSLVVLQELPERLSGALPNFSLAQCECGFRIAHSFSERAVTIKPQGEPAGLFASLGEGGRSALQGASGVLVSCRRKWGLIQLASF